jgi:2'-hydroxyisoflavone reductase
MRVLVIGGTEFVGRHIVHQAVAAGHDVTVFHRGRTEPPDLPEVAHVHGDRDGGLGALEGGTWDWAVDVCGYDPRLVRSAGDALESSVGRYCFISTESVYAEPLPALVAEDAPLATMAAAEGAFSWYGPLKVLCERVARAVFGDRLLVVRPGYVVGPLDTTDRFTSWVRRVSLGGSILAPGTGAEVFQFVDARDLGAFVVGLLEREVADTFNADGHPLTLAGFLETCAGVTQTEPRLVWLPPDVVRECHLEEAFPMCDGSTTVMDASRAREAGLAHRSVEESIADTLAWDRERGLPPLTAGIAPEEEARLLAEFG